MTDFFDILLLPIFQRALLIGLILGTLMAILGVLVVLRRMSFFADAIGHSALTGIALGILLAIDPLWAAMAFAMLVAALIAVAKNYSRLPLDTLLAVFFPSAVALGVILVQLSPGYQADLVSFLFGDILSVGPLDVWVAIGLAVIVIGVMLGAGKSLVYIAFDETLAKVDGVPVKAFEILLLVLLAMVVAASIKIVGIILVTALMVIPAASAQNLARSLVSMFALSIVISILAVVSGMLVSAALGVPSGPAVVLAGAVFFMSSLVLKAGGVRV